MHKAENAWKPYMGKSLHSQHDAGETEMEEILRSLKYTPERFEHLVHQVTQLAIDTEEKLNVFTELIYDKVLLQRGEHNVNFHWLLLRKCQRKI